MIYLDNAATTPLDEEVLKAMLPYFCQTYGNAQSQHAAGRAAASALLAARDELASIFGCKGEEVYFLSGGTEAGNLAVKGVCEAYKTGHIIVSELEHPSVYESALKMRERGFELTVLKPSKEGVISPESVESAIKPNTIFCAVMAANNEIGTIQPYEEIAEICAEHGVFYYADCVQSASSLPFPKGASAFAVSAHKFNGPKGIAAMYIKDKSPIKPIIDGGRQERGLRGGTSNVAAAVGLAAALKAAVENREKNNLSIKRVRDIFLDNALKIEGAHLNGSRELRIPSNANLSFDGCAGEKVVFNLDLKGVCASTGSACSAGAVTPSRVVESCVGSTRAAQAVRFTFGKYNTEQDALLVADILKKVVLQIRN